MENVHQKFAGERGSVMQSTLSACFCGLADSSSKREANASNSLAAFRDIDSSSIEIKAPTNLKKRNRSKQSQKA
jgi:hypothetical protein